MAVGDRNFARFQWEVEAFDHFDFRLKKSNAQLSNGQQHGWFPLHRPLQHAKWTGHRQILFTSPSFPTILTRKLPVVFPSFHWWCFSFLILCLSSTNLCPFYQFCFKEKNPIQAYLISLHFYSTLFLDFMVTLLGSFPLHCYLYYNFIEMLAFFFNLIGPVYCLWTVNIIHERNYNLETYFILNWPYIFFFHISHFWVLSIVFC